MRGVCGSRYGDLTVAAMVGGLACLDLTGNIDRCGGVTDLWRGMDWPRGRFNLVVPTCVGGLS